MIVLPLALRPFCESYGDVIQCKQYNKYNNIHRCLTWLAGLGWGWGVEGLLGRMGFEDRRVDTALEHEIFTTLRIERDDKDRKKGVKCLVTSHKAAILEKVREMPIWTGVREMPIWTGVREMPISPIHNHVKIGSLYWTRLLETCSKYYMIWEPAMCIWCRNIKSFFYAVPAWIGYLSEAEIECLRQLFVKAKWWNNCLECLWWRFFIWQLW